MAMCVPEEIVIVCSIEHRGYVIGEGREARG